MKVYGLTEIARSLGVEAGLVSKWRERDKLPPPDAVLSVGPVWLASSIEPLISAGGPDPRPPGERLTRFAVTARVTTGPYPAMTADSRDSFSHAIAQIQNHASNTVDWERDNQAVVHLGCCVAHDPDTAGESAKTIIMRRAQSEAQIGVRDVTILAVDPLGDW